MSTVWPLVWPSCSSVWPHPPRPCPTSYRLIPPSPPCWPQVANERLEEATRWLDEEKKRSDALLYRMLPADIAQVGRECGVCAGCVQAASAYVSGSGAGGERSLVLAEWPSRPSRVGFSGRCLWRRM